MPLATEEMAACPSCGTMTHEIGDCFACCAKKNSDRPKQMPIDNELECLECRYKLTLEEAERVIDEGDGCPGCGGSDIDIQV